MEGSIYTDKRLWKSFSTFKSQNGPNINLTFVNNTSDPVQTVWIDYNSEQVPYSLITPNSESPQGTCAGHPWIFKNINGVVFAAFLAPIDSHPNQSFFVHFGLDGSVSVNTEPMVKNSSESVGKNRPHYGAPEIIQCTTEYYPKIVHGFTLMVDPTVTQDVLTGIEED